MNNTTPVSSEPVKSSSWNKTAVATTVLAAALVGGNVYQMNRANTLDDQLKDVRTAMKTEIVTLQTQSDATTARNSQLLSALEAKISETGARSQKAASQAVSQASQGVRKVNDQISRKLEEQQKTQLEQHEALTAQLGELKQDTSQTITKVSGIADEVTGVKGDVAQTRTELDRTVGDLKSMRGDMGVQSGLIATNSKELTALRALGERDYIEFQLAKTKAPQRIGDVAMQLKKSDSKRNRFTIELLANDKKVEKKDRTVNEPVQFYMASARIPYEIVVNEVRNDKIVGYLAAPKVRNSR